MPKPKLAIVVNQVTKIPLRLQVDGVEHLVIYENGAVHLEGKKVGSDPVLAAALLNVTPVKATPLPAAKKRAARKPAARKPAFPATSSPVD